MTPRDDHDAVLALLERKLNASAPRDANPVATVVRRARSARRRRVIASTCVALVAVAGLGTTGAVLLRDRSPSPGPVADLSNASNLRPVTDWTGTTVRFHGLTLPVPEGWTVKRSTDLHGTCLGAAPKTLWLFDVPVDKQFLGGCRRPGASPEQMWAVDQTLPSGSFGGDNPVALDPSGQPVMMPDLTPPSQPYAGLAFPWLDVEVDTSDVPADELLPMLAAVHADPVTPSPGLHVPNGIDDASYQRYGGTSRHAPKANGTIDPTVVGNVLRSATPDTALRCVPKVGASLTLQQDDPFEVRHLMFDTTGACDQVTDDQGGLATLDAVALRTLTKQVGAEPGQPAPTYSPIESPIQPVHEPAVDGLLQCPTDQPPEGLVPVTDHGPWVKTPQAAGDEWLARQTDRDEFATVAVVHDDKVTSHLLVKNNEGNPTAVVYLLVNAFKGWKLQGAEACQVS